MFENPRRGRQARNLTTKVSKILGLKSSSEQIFFRKLSLGAPAWVSLSCRGHSVFCFNSGLTVAFSHSSKLFFLKWYQQNFHIFSWYSKTFFSFKSMVHKQISSHWIQTTISLLGIWTFSMARWFIRVSIAFKVPLTTWQSYQSSFLRKL